MIYPPGFREDMYCLSRVYRWSEKEMQEMRIACTNCAEMVRYFSILAAAHRAGYVQNAGNGFMRLRDWCLQQGFGDPYGDQFNLAALKSLQLMTG
jgi:hypothetical protein